VPHHALGLTLAERHALGLDDAQVGMLLCEREPHVTLAVAVAGVWCRQDLGGEAPRQSPLTGARGADQKVGVDRRLRRRLELADRRRLVDDVAPGVDGHQLPGRRAHGSSLASSGQRATTDFHTTPSTSSAGAVPSTTTQWDGSAAASAR
jgi:hypothetical protein